MFSIVRERLRQQHRTMSYPDQPATVPDRLRGLPLINDALCQTGCEACAASCPTDAIDLHGRLSIDLGRCLFCTECTSACPTGAVSFSTDYRLAVRKREDLKRTADAYRLGGALEARSLKLFGRSLKLRQVSAGGCNGCEADVNVLNTVVFDLGRFGIQFVASPRHADGLLITGPVTENMRRALKIAHEAVPPPRLVVAVGACALSGGPYVDHAEQHNGADSVVPVDLYIPGCPPHPLTILDGLLRLLNKLPASSP